MIKRISPRRCGILRAAFLTMCILFSVTSINAEELPVTITGENKEINIGPHSEYYIDHTKTAAFEEILLKEGEFRQYKKKSYQFGFSRSTVWIRVRIKKADSLQPDDFKRTRLVLDNPALGSVVLFVPVIRKGVKTTVTTRGGWMNPQGTLDNDFLYTTFMFPDDYDDTRPLYIRVETPYAYNFGITLYSWNSFMRTSYLLMIMIGLCIGVLISMFLYNLVIYFFIKEKQYLFYILHVLGQLMYQSVLFGFARYINYSAGSFLLSYILLLTSLSVFFALLFAKTFLVTGKTAPRHDVVIKILMTVMAVVFVLTILEYRWTSNVVLYVFTQVSVLVCISAGVASYRFGFKPALYFIIAFMVLALSTVIFILRVVYIVPENTLTQHSIFFGTALESILLSFALGYRIRIMREKEQSLTAMSITDELTGIYNKRHFSDVFRGKLLESESNNTPVSLMMLDVDHFKRYNDSYGHQEGDTVLRELGTVIKETLRGDDIPCRYGGEEFSVILPDSNIEAGVFVAERIRTRFMEKVFTPGKSKGAVTVTVSIGVGTWNGKESGDAFFKRCDKALYAAKGTGRNRVISAES
ncbi:MAG TPA: diguanylate cyclase [Spirochaetota bacterium]|nr:diguanylate cyclase [Spirochaetota bacterium]